MRTSKFSDEGFTEIFQSSLSNEDKAKRLGISVAYMKAKSKKLGIKADAPKVVVKDDDIVIVTEIGTYVRSYCTYATDAVVKAKDLRELIECNDTEFIPTKFIVNNMTEEEQEKETFMVSKLKRNYGDPHV
jgi:hypothetical protein